MVAQGRERWMGCVLVVATLNVKIDTVVLSVKVGGNQNFFK